MKHPAKITCHVDLPSTWVRYRKGLCHDCQATCCSLPVEVTVTDLIRMELADPFEEEGPVREIARRLRKQGLIDHFNFKTELFTLARLANDDCIFLDQQSRRCTIYAKRPDTCRNHPQVGPRPGYCAYRPKESCPAHQNKKPPS